MTFNSKYRYPDAPATLTPDQRRVWNTLVRILEQRDFDFLFGQDSTINVNKIKDGVFTKGFTTISSTYYCSTNDGTLLVDSSASTVTVFLTSAIDSRYSMVCVKKTTSGNPVLVRDASGALIDSSVETTVSAHHDSKTFSCDGARWWVISNN